eukprot:272525_1
MSKKVLVYGIIREIISDDNIFQQVDEIIFRLTWKYYCQGKKKIKGTKRLKNCFFVYGTLRDDIYRNRKTRSTKKSGWSVGATKVNLGIIYGFKMYGIDSFPYAVKTNNTKDFMIGRLIYFKNDKKLLLKLLNITNKNKRTYFMTLCFAACYYIDQDFECLDILLNETCLDYKDIFKLFCHKDKEGNTALQLMFRDYNDKSDVNRNPNIIKLFKYFCKNDKKLLFKLLFQSFGVEQDDEKQKKIVRVGMSFQIITSGGLVIAELSQIETLRQLILMVNDDKITMKILSYKENLHSYCHYLMKSWLDFVKFSSLFQTVQNKDICSLLQQFKNNPIITACYFNKYQILDQVLNFLQISNEEETIKKLMLSSFDTPDCLNKIAIMAATPKCRIKILKHYEMNYNAILLMELLTKATRKHQTTLFYIAEQNDTESLQFILNSSLIDKENKVNLLTHECDVILPRKDQCEASNNIFVKKQTIIGHLFRKGLGLYILKYFENDKKTLLKLLNVRNEIKRTPLLTAAATNSKILKPLLNWIFNESLFDYKEKISLLFDNKTILKYDAKNHGIHDTENMVITEIINYLQSQKDDKTLCDLLLSSKIFFSDSCIPNGLNYIKKV